MLPSVLPAGTRYLCGGEEFELLESSTQQADGSYQAVRRRSVSDGIEHAAAVSTPFVKVSLDLRNGVTLPEPVKLDPYAEHRKKIGDDK